LYENFLFDHLIIVNFRLDDFLIVNVVNSIVIAKITFVLKTSRAVLALVDGIAVGFGDVLDEIAL